MIARLIALLSILYVLGFALFAVTLGTPAPADTPKVDAIVVITGGKGTLAGPIVGGLIFGMLPVALRGFASPVAQWIIYGVLMILIVFFLPRGIVPAVREWWENRKPVDVRLREARGVPPR